MRIKYTCKECGRLNQIVGFWRWFFTPHFGSKKWLKCKRCDAKRHFMVRTNWNGPSWLDWPN